MSSGLPELGSKISLISKADIRYEGRLYTVDPQECTIALSCVRSFGTEDRETQFQIAPQSQIYDYILFRGSDIKDIRVVNNAMAHPQDPAIMQVQLPNGQHLMPHFTMPNMNAPHAPSMGGAAYSSPFGAMGLGGAMGGANQAGDGAASLAPGAPGPFMLGNQQSSQQQQQQKPAQQQKQPISVIDMLAGASRSTTPISLISRKSPSNELGLNQDAQQQHQLHQSNQQQHQSNQNIAGHGGNSRDAGQHKRQNHHPQQHQQQQRGGGGAGNNHQQRNGNNDFYNQGPPRRRDNIGSGRLEYNNPHHDGRNYNARNNHPGAGGQGGQMRGSWTTHRGGPNNPNNMMRNHRGGGGRGRMPNQDFRMGGSYGGGNPNKPRQRMKPLKFENDFDFEQANNKFEELRSQLSKLKVGDDAKSTEQSTTPTPSQMNGETDKKDDSGNETGAGEHEPEEEEITIGYDKTKSFFDNISCEAAQDRSKNKKIDWRQERKLNTQTFGVSTSWHPPYNRHNMMNQGGNYRKPGFDYYNMRNRNNYRNNNGRNNNRNNNNNHSNNKRGSIGGGATSRNNGENANSNNTEHAEVTAAALKTQAQANDASATNSSAVKTATQESNPQPVAVVSVQ